MKVIIIGCTHAGTVAATEILKNHPETDLTIYERTDNFSFLSCGISLYLQGEVKHLEDMFYSSPEELQEMGATVHDNHDVLKVDAAKHTIQVANMVSGDVFEDTYDKLIMTTGSSVMVPPLFGIDNTRVLLCKNYQQAQEIYKASEKYHDIAIVGAGYAGIEFAEALSENGHHITLFQSRSQVLNNYVDKPLSDWAVKLLQDHKVDVHLEHEVTAFSGNEDDSKITIETNQGDFKADVVIVSTGFTPNTSLLTGQVDIERHGSFSTNRYLQTSDPDIYAAGDCCMVTFNPTGAPAYTPLASVAIRQGMLVAHNIFGHTHPYIGTQASSALKLYGNALATTGLTLIHAKERGINAASVTLETTWRPEYMPSTDPLTIYLVYNRDNRRVLGAQLLSRHDITQSANAVSLAIQNNNTIDDLAFVDMLFQPNFDFPFNYLNQVAQLAIDQEQAAGNGKPRFTALGNANSDQ
ncbi:FAD-dependent oxidoreductase [Secundilactobacillus folii]|uniref:SidA/IucD/PvdA family monooxygenase n=1 Tax=Secundilactobacillus folii TaxID=2678357 RepID=A0A7X2XUL2_9LACO|nr:FAD-dependent oxidoreductase [Secundilactobacillus folii]MTV81800.1 SidA/IucD/PvdA family monooxygenase [Secundilactobacillus folii]